MAGSRGRLRHPRPNPARGRDRQGRHRDPRAEQRPGRVNRCGRRGGRAHAGAAVQARRNGAEGRFGDRREGRGQARGEAGREARREARGGAARGVRGESSTANGETAPATGAPLTTPSTRKLAHEMGVDITRVQATGERGRVTRDDVVRAVGQSSSPPPIPTEARPAPQASHTAELAQLIQSGGGFVPRSPAWATAPTRCRRTCRSPGTRSSRSIGGGGSPPITWSIRRPRRPTWSRWPRSTSTSRASCATSTRTSSRSRACR